MLMCEAQPLLWENSSALFQYDLVPNIRVKNFDSNFFVLGITYPASKASTGTKSVSKNANLPGSF